MLDLQQDKSSVSYKHGVTDMLVNWIDVRSKLTHFGALVITWFWFEYTTDLAFRNGVESWVGGLHPFYRGLFGALTMFYMWYRNPTRKE